MSTTKTGFMVFLPRFSGSKSERFYPCLVQAESVTDWVRHQADDPFNHQTLRQYHLKYVEVSGEDSDDGIFRVESIKELPSPYPRTADDVLR